MSRIYDALKDAEHRRTNGAESAAVAPPAKRAAAPLERTGLMGALKTKLFSSARPGDEAALTLRSPSDEGDPKRRPATVVDSVTKPGPAAAKAVERPGERPTTDRARAPAAGGSLPATSPEVARGEHRAADLSGSLATETAGLSQQLGSVSAEITALEAGFSRLAERLVETARNLQQSGAVPSEGSITEVSDCRRDFQAVGARVTKLARSVGVPAQYLAAPPGSIGDLRALLEVASFHDGRRRAIAVLDRVLSIAHRDSAEFQPLSECQAGARQLREAIISADWPAHHPDSQSLSSAGHPFAKLVILVERGEKLSDEQWLGFHDAVAESFGKPLAVAITRNRLRMEGASSVGAPIPESPVEESALRNGAAAAETTGRCWSCDAELEGGAKFCGECGAPSS